MAKRKINYIYPLTKPLKFRGCVIKNVGQGTFTIEKVTRDETTRDKLDRLKTILRRRSPKLTRRMSRDWVVDAFKSSTLFYTVTIGNKVDYVRFPYNHYLKKGNNFVYDSAKEWINYVKK